MSEREVDPNELRAAIEKLTEFLREHHPPEMDFLGRSYSREANGIYARFWMLLWGDEEHREDYEEAIKIADKARWKRLDKSLKEVREYLGKTKTPASAPDKSDF